MDEDEEEPRLKYSRLTGNLVQVLIQDAISSLSVSNRFIALGTHSGSLHLIDLMGVPVKEWKCHQSTITQISIDDNEEFIASSSGDGTVVISSLYNNDKQTYYYKRPVHGVQLEKEYSKKPSKQFIYGGAAGTLLLSGRGWFGTSVTTIDQGQGSILSISWRGTVVVWANEQGIDLYDIPTSTKFGHIDKDAGPRPEIFRCNFVWVNDEQFMYSWGDCVKVVDICQRSQMDIGSGMSQKYIQISHQFKTDFVVSGLAPFEGGILLLAYLIDIDQFIQEEAKLDSSKKKFEPPEIYIVDMNGNEVANDLLSIPGYELFHANDYRLEYLKGETNSENSYYILSPKDIILAKPRDVFDHVEWLVDCGKYRDALELVEANKSQYVERQLEEAMLTIGCKYLDSLFTQNDFITAALICPKILKKEKDLWEEWVYKFADKHQIKAIYALIPTSNPVLSHTVYEMVLYEFLTNDLCIYLDIVQTWPSNIYSAETMIMAVEMNLKGEKDTTLLRKILVELCSSIKQYEKATYYGMLLRNPLQVELIETHNLINFLDSNILLVLQYERDVIPKPYLENSEIVDPTQLLRDLQNSKGATLLLNHSDHISVFSFNSSHRKW
jgi:vacuolar protein sorting-associated protein 41